ncbi:hypothetical protein B0G80_0372 [Paraburkholderia sp. BL6669N2]|uniref:hypothetical protein n=1 Tax=Paraburkholderia sp. BL6669N2 TaxID=1938807 RepID=UPI000E39B676|nr:hypothetical protein [Paraburkholderia sp. BL6669N2]REG57742.1 hypothetical protein B0G80_0372 [Paraburkholderia sp. BL6669N2]
MKTNRPEAEMRAKFEAAWSNEYPLHGTTTFKRSGINPDAYVNTRVQDGWLMYRTALATIADQSASGGAPEGWKLVPVERSYDMRVKALIAFNTTEQSGKDRDDALDAAHRATLAAAPAPVAPTDERVDQWQSRVRNVASAEWINITEEGAATIREKYSDSYELRALYDRAASTQATATLTDEHAETLYRLARMTDFTGWVAEFRQSAAPLPRASEPVEGEAVTQDAERYRAFFDAGLPICFCGAEYHDKASLDAAIDAARAKDRS